MNNLRATDIMREALRGNDIGDAMDRLVERALGDLAAPTGAGREPSLRSRPSGRPSPIARKGA